MFHLRLRRGERIRRSWRCQLSRSQSCQCSLSPVGNRFVVPRPIFPSVILIFYHCISIFCLPFFYLYLLLLSSRCLGFLANSLLSSIGLFSMNVNVPHNGWKQCPTHNLCEPDGSLAPFNYFAAIVTGIALVACCMVSIIRWWRWNARKKFGRLRGVEVPSAWDGFWGWE